MHTFSLQEDKVWFVPNCDSSMLECEYCYVST